MPHVQSPMHFDTPDIFGKQVKEQVCDAADKGARYGQVGDIVELSSPQRKPTCKLDLISKASHSQRDPALFCSQLQSHLCRFAPERLLRKVVSGQIGFSHRWFDNYVSLTSHKCKQRHCKKENGFPPKKQQRSAVGLKFAAEQTHQKHH